MTRSLLLRWTLVVSCTLLLGSSTLLAQNINTFDTPVLPTSQHGDDYSNKTDLTVCILPRVEGKTKVKVPYVVHNIKGELLLNIYIVHENGEKVLWDVVERSYKAVTEHGTVVLPGEIAREVCVEILAMDTTKTKVVCIVTIEG